MSSAAVVICAVRVIVVVIYNYYIYYTQKWYQAYPGIPQAATLVNMYLTLKAPSKIAADDILLFFHVPLSFEENKACRFMCILAEESHEVSSLIFSEKINEKHLRMSSAVVEGKYCTKVCMHVSR